MNDIRHQRPAHKAGALNLSGNAAVRAPAWWQSPLPHLQMLLLLAVAFGGGGVGYGLRNAAIQLAALAICAAHPALLRDFLCNGPRALVLLVVFSMAIPLVQLTPLPPALWQGLPGRTMIAESLALAGFPADSWRPASVDAARTLVAFCGTLAPATIIAIGARLNDKAKLHLALTLAGAGIASVLLGVVQVTGANTAGLLFPITPKEGVLYAGFANRNSTGLFLNLALLAVCALPLPRRAEGLLAIVAGASMLALGVVLTQSRSSLVLLALPLGLAASRVGMALWRRRGGKTRALGPAGLLAAGFALVVSALAVVSVADGGRVSQTLERFSTLQEDRLTIWEDGQFAARAYWPLGAGTGTFDEVYQVYESLEYVSQKKAGRMHNDYLEVILESGLAGVIMVALWLFWLAWMLLRSMFVKADRQRWSARAAGLGTLAIALQSVLDYPLRNQTLLCTAALLVILVVPCRGERDKPRRQGAPR